MEGMFNEVFSKISLTKGIKETFSNAEVRKITYKKEDKHLRIYLYLPRIIEESNIILLKKEVQKEIKGLNNVEVYHEYDTLADLTPEFMKSYISNVFVFCKEKSPVCGSILETSKWEFSDGCLNFTIKNGGGYYLTKRGFNRLIEDKFKNQLGIDVKVNIFDESITEEERANYVQEHKKSHKAALDEMGIEEPLAAAKQPVLMPKADIKGNVIVGKAIKGELETIKTYREDGSYTVIWGEILRYEERALKNEKYLITFDITDTTDSTTIKFFAKAAEMDAIRKNIQKGKCVKVRGMHNFDKYSKMWVIMAKDIEIVEKPKDREDLAEVKRVELHMHSQMSSMDGISSVKSIIEKAKEFGHKAVAITDHGVVQGFPDAMDAAKGGIKVIYGVEGYLVDDLGVGVKSYYNETLDDTFVVFDIETTGLSPKFHKIIEIAAIKVKGGEILEKFETFVNPHEKLSYDTTRLTGITDEQVINAPDIKKVLVDFLEFSKDSVLVAHNASFDMSFIKSEADKEGIEVRNSQMDTLEISRYLLPNLKKHTLDSVCKHLDVKLINHHRAIHDTQALVEIFFKLTAMLKEKNVDKINKINELTVKNKDFKKERPHHIIIIAKNKIGLRNLYELVSSSHLNYFFKRPRILKSELIKHREGLILGTACEAGEFYKAILYKKDKKTIEALVDFYDYLEIQPICNNTFMVDNNMVSSIEELQNINKEIVQIGKQYGKPVVATCDAHFVNPEEEIFRKIIQCVEGYKDADRNLPLYFRTTEEMLKEFQYLGEDCYKVVVENTNLIADMVEEILPIPKETYPPKIEGAEAELKDITIKKAVSIYGERLPEPVKERLDRELHSIIKNGFAVMYIIAKKLVWKSLEDGYLVGSRGSVGSSFVATMAGITEVNPLPPHYVCPKCHYSDFESDIVIGFAGRSGCDMPDVDCPNCGTKLNKDGHDIPFETFLGFDGDKEPDIDLNFSGEYQQIIHTYTEELFGSENVFKAGTIGTIAEKTAYGFVKKYIEEKNLVLHEAEIARLSAGITGIKRTTGQHPGGLMIVPKENNIHEFCPVQRPANDAESTITTTHFDYHSISGRLLKLDLLGHDDPTVIRMLYDLTGVNPQNVPLDDKKTMSLFTKTDALSVTPEDIRCETGTLAIPEFGTKFVRQMLMDTMPTTFSELVRISGLSHGTDVWLNNAQEYVRKKAATLKDVISTRDDIMVYLIIKGLPKLTAFKIMESVRKGNGISEEHEKLMQASGVDDWYIESCKKIQYMFPKAHAAAYVMMAFRIAYFKVNYPEAFYTSYFTVRAAGDFDYVTMCKGAEICLQEIYNIESKGNEMTAKEKSKLTVLEVVYEMYKRGIKFVPLDLYKSDANKFIMTEEGILPPFSSIAGLGESAAKNVIEARKEAEFTSIADFKMRTKISKTTIELLKENKVLEGLPDTNQLSLF